MATKKQDTHAKPFSLCIREDRAVEDTLLDQTLVKVDAKSYQHYLGILDQPPSSEGFARLMNAPKPWRD